MNPHNLDYYIKSLRTQLQDGNTEGALRVLEDMGNLVESEVRSYDEDSQHDYFKYVEDLAKDILDEAIKEVGPDKDDVEYWVERESYDKVHEAVDGSQWVIYTRLAMKVLLYSNNDGYGFEEGLLDTSKWKDGIDYSAVAFWAMRQDVQERLTELVGEYEGPEEEEVTTCVYCHAPMAEGEGFAHLGCTEDNNSEED